MTLTGSQIERIRNTILAAYSIDELRIVVRTCLDADLDAIVPKGSFSAQVLDLVQWADRRGKAGLLVQCAHQHNPENEGLKALWAEMQGRPMSEAPADLTTAEDQPKSDVAGLGEASVPQMPASLLAGANDPFRGDSADAIRLKDRSQITPLDKVIRNAEIVEMVGINLHGPIARWETVIQREAGAGCRFDFIVLDPDFFEHGADIADSWHGDKRFASKYRLNLMSTVAAVEKIASYVGADKIHLYFTPMPPPYSLLIVDRHRPDGGFLQVEMYTFGGAAQDRPHFVLTSSLHRKWFDFFTKEFALARTSARPHELRAQP